MYTGTYNTARGLYTFSMSLRLHPSSNKLRPQITLHPMRNESHRATMKSSIYTAGNRNALRESKVLLFFLKKKLEAEGLEGDAVSLKMLRHGFDLDLASA